MLAFVGAFLMCCVCQGSRGTDRIPANFSEYNVLSAAKGAKLMIDGRGILMDFQTKRPVGTKPTPLPNSPPTPSTPSTPNTPPPSHTPPPRNTPPSPNTLPPPNTTPTLPKPQTSRPPGSSFSLGQPLNTWECERVTAVPSRVRSEYRLSWFYRKYLHAYGIPIISSDRAQDAALRRACYVVVFLFADRQDIRTWFYKRHGRAGVIAHTEGVTSIPEHSWLPSWWNQRARGLGATLTHPISTCGEENILCYQSGDRYPREDIFLHEFVHGLHLLGIASNGAIPNFDTKLRQRYNQLKSSGRLWRNTYAMSTDREYLAEGAQSYFDCNDERNPPNGIHNHVNTRAELMLYDPVLYGFLKEIFPCQNKYLKRCDAKVGVKPYHFKMNCDRHGRGILMDFQTKRPVGTKPTPLPNTPPTPNTPPPPNTPPLPHTSPPPNTPPPPNTLPPPNTTPTPPKPQTSRPPVCRDYDHRCGNWARNGECYRNPRYMLRYCKKSCKRCTTVSCKDFHWRCQAWSKRGECHRNPGYMLVSCKRSCRKC